MLSVLIPLYRQKVEALVHQLHRQLSQERIPFEIILGDDSNQNVESSYENDFSDLAEVTLLINSNQLGRSKNRNHLAEQAKYPYLLFLDGDASIPHPGFIANYLQNLRPDLVLCGGTAYQEAAPLDRASLLRWTYGSQREVTPAALRNRQPYGRFSSFNFLIPNDLFSQVKFEEGFSLYGHEDTFFGYALECQKINVLHIDNPAQHDGLDTAGLFLDKVEQSLIALNQYMKEKKLPWEFFDKIRLCQVFSKLKSLRLRWLMRLVYRLGKRAIIKQLHSARPWIFLLDVYKLAYLNHIAT